MAKETDTLEFKVLVLGDSGTGKTAMVRRMVKDEFCENYTATIGVDFSVKVVPLSPASQIRLQLWDLAGQDRFNHLSRLYYKHAAAAFLVYDESRPSSLDSIQRWKGELDARLQHPIPCVLLSNKSDLPVSQVTDEMLEDLCERLNILTYIRTSAKDGTGVSESVKTLVWGILTSKEAHDLNEVDEERDGVIQIQNNMSSSLLAKKKCCSV